MYTTKKARAPRKVVRVLRKSAGNASSTSDRLSVDYSIARLTWNGRDERVVLVGRLVNERMMLAH